MKDKYEKYHKEVAQKLLATGKPWPAGVVPAQDNYNSSYKLHQIDKKSLDVLRKKGFSFSVLEPDEQAKIWSYIFKNTDYMDVGHLAIDHFKSLQGKKNHNLLQYWPLLKTWVGTIENWAHADMLASVYCDIHSENPKVVYPELLKWSKSPSPWKNRMAIVSLLYYYNPKRYLPKFSEVMAIVKPHLGKDHYYLQKAIGWNLREMTRAYPDRTWRFLNKHATEISSTAFSTAVEKLPKEKKEILKRRRKDARKLKKKMIATP